MNGNHFVDNSPPSLHFPKPLLFLFGASIIFILGMTAQCELNKRNTNSEIARLTDNNLKLVAVNKRIDSDRNNLEKRLTQRETQVRNLKTCLEQSGLLEAEKWVKK